MVIPLQPLLASLIQFSTVRFSLHHTPINFLVKHFEEMEHSHNNKIRIGSFFIVSLINFSKVRPLTTLSHDKRPIILLNHFTKSLDIRQRRNPRMLTTIRLRILLQTLP